MPEVTYVGEPEEQRTERPISRILKWGFLLAFLLPMAVVLIGGWYNAKVVPPYPERIVTNTGEVLATKADIMRGQHLFQRYGLMDLGSVWGHGSLRGSDFSAESLHLIGTRIQSWISNDRFGGEFSRLSREDQAVVEALKILDLRTNTYDAETGDLHLSKAKSAAYRDVVDYWDRIFLEGDLPHAIPANAIAGTDDRRLLGTFFFWTAWAAGTERPGTNFTYTNNWPPDRSVGNVAPDDAIIWSLAGVLSLFVVLGLVVYIVHRYRFFITEETLVHLSQRIATAPITKSQFKARKFFGVVMLLFILQIFMGGLLAHFTVHPGTFYLGNVAKLVSFNWAKTWHLQLGIFWIATAWVASALYIAPLIGGREPRKQGLLVDGLFVAVLLVAVGSLAGEVAGVKGMLGDAWFWLGHQGWEYLELGRLWQLLLFVGLLGWIGIAYRGIKPRLREEADRAGLYHFYLIAAVLVVLFFGFGLTYTPNTHLSIADYWRWFVVHIWVEGIFEFFAVATAALLLVMLGLVTKESALRAAYLTAILSFSAGIIGMSHHYFWFGQGSVWIALGSVFSSLEPIPLIMLASRAWMEYRTINEAGIEFPYRWPLMFLIASSFWNFLGGGVFGFLINLPIINYYEHATYLTSNHGHTALFGTYGMLAIALCAFVWRGMVRDEKWNPKWLKFSFWGLNIGLFLMFLTGLLPLGILEFMTAYREGLWMAKSAAFFDRPIVQLIGQWRIVPDTILIVLGAFPLGWFFLSTVRDLKPPTVDDGEAIFPEDE